MNQFKQAINNLSHAELIELRHKARQGDKSLDVVVHTFQAGELYSFESYGVYVNKAWVDTRTSWQEITELYPTAVRLS